MIDLEQIKADLEIATKPIAEAGFVVDWHQQKTDAVNRVISALPELIKAYETVREEAQSALLESDALLSQVYRAGGL